jgi:VIT1/CCC1 family predicted Fe2+/Mn2+ transporter
LEVAEQLTAHDDLGAHMRDELGLEAGSLARPFQAAVVSAVSFASLGVVPVVAMLLAPAAWRIPAIVVTALVSLGVLGAVGGFLGGASRLKAAARVLAGGSLAMAITAVIGRLVGMAV